MKGVLLTLPLLLALLAGCKAGPARPAGFVDSAAMSKPADLPFHLAWIKPGLDWNHYKKVYVAPVNTELLAQMDWWKALERGESFKKDARVLASYAQNTLKHAFAEDPKRHFEVVDQPGPDAVTLEFALVEVVPSKVVLNTLGYAPFVGTAFKIIRGTKSKSSVAFEARFKEESTGQTLATFADREFEKFSPLNVKDVTWYGHAESILYEWSRQLVQVVNRHADEAVRDSRPINLKPW